MTSNIEFSRVPQEEDKGTRDDFRKRMTQRAEFLRAAGRRIRQGFDA